ncbi:MAG: acyl-CoA thioesterase [Elusimicrobiales bacterium]|nr:acyl-CoA thioesterase [Elusimicrobiales bacterium]
MHITKKQIYYYDTDAEGVVYYGNYMRFLEVARTKFVEDLGFNLKKLADDGFLFAIRKQEIDYKAPVFYGETIEIRTRVDEISPYRMRFYYEIYNSKGQKTTIARTDMVSVNRSFHLSEMSENLFNKVKETMEKENLNH